MIARILSGLPEIQKEVAINLFLLLNLGWKRQYGDNGGHNVHLALDTVDETNEDFMFYIKVQILWKCTYQLLLGVSAWQTKTLDSYVIWKYIYANPKSRKNNRKSHFFIDSMKMEPYYQH